MRAEERLKLLAEKTLRSTRSSPENIDPNDDFAERVLRILPALIFLSIASINSRGWSLDSILRFLFQK